MRTRFALAIVFFGLGSQVLLGQTDPVVRPLPPASVGTETLGIYLRELGYEPRALSPDVFQITLEKDRWPVHVMLALSRDGRRVWLESKFAPIEDPDKVPARAWKRLLDANETIGPAHFSFDPRDRRVHLYKSFDNQHVSAERIKVEILQFDETVRKTHDVWRGENFKPVIASSEAEAAPEGPPAPKAEVAAVPVSRQLVPGDRLLQDWTITSIQVKGRTTPAEILSERKVSLVFRQARDGDFGPPLKGKLMAELRTSPDSVRTVRVILSPESSGENMPLTIDFVDEQERIEPGIYRIDGDTLTFCFAVPGEPRPTSFATSPESRNWLIELKRR